MMQYWYCYITIILKLGNLSLQESGHIIQEEVFCCIRDSLVQIVSAVFVF